jgi:hypothetical protein
MMTVQPMMLVVLTMEGMAALVQPGLAQQLGSSPVSL